ncbi:thiosulfate/3-mercaptopyruvate sulfurtransferase [Tenacibaculum adriaticum]|uniref:Thiosulfate/3-mercaptopyruvate sulfurtransferase n=1 Tax=Tenacibaculum adriaticum TaxID=413713 RepID=A0A5S5DVD0_9FLAO|nr:sulfurtransferase [Tenacibaculum adriaticum]TYP98732.1 thiosulfate/3-mercaptopyruvate sulfurtransferase [Tenacibaculum adriaticum]
MKLKITTPIVSVTWLHENINAENLIIFDATIPKVGISISESLEKKQIIGARFFDIKKGFSLQNSQYPNTILSSNDFEQRAQNLGVNKDTCIVVYDDHGIYSAPRVWWLFKTFGFTNIAVLDGGFPEWNRNGLPVENPAKEEYEKGDFIVKYQSDKISFTDDVLLGIQQEVCITDARSRARFFAEELEPREEIRSGHIPNSFNLPYTELQVDGKMKDSVALSLIFSRVNLKQNRFIFTCGSGITACILALGLEISGNSNYSVYDGSWSEWGSRKDLPVKTK